MRMALNPLGFWALCTLCTSIHPCSTGSAVQALSRTHSQSSRSSHSDHSYHSYHPGFAPNFLRVYPEDFRLLVCPQLVTLFEISSDFSCLLSAVSQSVLFTQMQICSTSRRLISFVECCRVCPWTSLKSARRETRCTWCQLCCEPFRLFSECSITTGAAVFPHETSVICAVVRLIN